MPKPEIVPDPIQGLSRAAEKAADAGALRVEEAAAAFNERFVDGFPPAHDDDGEGEESAVELAALPADLDAALENFLGNAPTAPGIVEHARFNFPHADDFPSLPTEILFGGTVEV